MSAAGKRAMRPPSEYLYGGHQDYDDNTGRPYLSLKRFRITRKMATRIYYLRKGEEVDEHGEPIDYGNIKDPDRGRRITIRN